MLGSPESIGPHSHPIQQMEPILFPTCTAELVWKNNHNKIQNVSMFLAWLSFSEMVLLLETTVVTPHKGILARDIGNTSKYYQGDWT